MSVAVEQARPLAEVSEYPNYAQAKAYLKNYLRHGRRSFIHTKRYAYFQHSSLLRVIVIRLVRDIYEVRAYPMDTLYVATIEQALNAENFRAWILASDYRNHSIYYITGTQRVGTQLYKLIKQAIKSKRKLSRASLAYPLLHH